MRREPLLGRDRQRVGEHDLAGAAVCEPLRSPGRTARRAWRRSTTSGRALGEQLLDGLGDGAAGVDHVVDHDAEPARDLADHPVGDDLVGPQRVAGLVDERDRRAAEVVGPLLGQLGAARRPARRR